MKSIVYVTLFVSLLFLAQPRLASASNMTSEVGIEFQTGNDEKKEIELPHKLLPQTGEKQGHSASLTLAGAILLVGGMLTKEKVRRERRQEE